MKKQFPTNISHLFFLSVTAIFLASLLTTGHVTADTLLFQSPVEEEPPPTEIPTEVPTEIPTEVPTEIPTETPVPAEQSSPPISEPMELLSDEPTDVLTDEPTVEPAESVEQPPVLQDVDTPLQKDKPEVGNNWIFDRAEFVDTVIIMTSWVWLCCGMALFLLVPLTLLTLQIRGRSKLRKQNRRVTP
jgi:hypothetical protein